MKLFRFDPSVAVPIDRFESRNFSISRLLTEVKNFQRLGCMNLGKDGVVGYHQATCPQLFMVVAGHGWVTGEDRKTRIPITVGQAAFWQAGEWHESGTADGMTAMVIEAELLRPEAFMPALVLPG